MLIDVTRSLPIPLTTQVAASLRSAIASGSLRPGDEVPSTRVLARQAGVSRGTVVTAYDQLISEGYLVATQGAPTRVNPSLPAAHNADHDTGAPRPSTAGPTRASRESRTPQPSRPAPTPTTTPAPTPAPTPGPTLAASHRRRNAPIISLKPSSGHAGAIRPAAWRQAWREAAAEPGIATEPTGQEQLREAIAEHLRMGRGLSVDKHDVVVTGGTREGLVLVLMALADERRLRVGVEDPGHPGLRNVVPLTGNASVPCAVDDAGVDIGQLPDDLDALLVTPAYQYPLGASMPAARRRALLDWAAATGTVVIEDDFNAELRYRTSPVPPLAALGGEAEVVTLGTFTTLLNRSAASGYVAALGQLADNIRRTRGVLGMPVSPVTQLAVAHLLRNGHVRRNTKAVHNRLAKRREIVAAEIIPQLTRRGATVTEMAESNGVDLAVTFPTPAARDAYARELADKGIESGRLDALWSGRDDGLIVSFAHLTEPDFRRVVEVMRSGSSN